jgi:hypothetical protein
MNNELEGMKAAGLWVGIWTPRPLEYEEGLLTTRPLVWGHHIGRIWIVYVYNVSAPCVNSLSIVCYINSASRNRIHDACFPSDASLATYGETSRHYELISSQFIDPFLCTVSAYDRADSEYI